MKPGSIKLPAKRIGVALLVLIVGVGGWTWQRWLPPVNSLVQHVVALFRTGSEAPPADIREHNAHDEVHAGHDHAGHDEATSLELSEQALRNIGLSDATIRPVRLQTFRRSITVPAIIAERPGRTRVQVATPMTGVITHVHAVQGEAVEPGTLLFQIRLTHEDLVQAQSDFLRTLGELDVEQQEIKRLSDITTSGAVAGKLLLERQYAMDKLNASLRAQRESLRLHGLSDNQVEHIEEERRLLRELRVYAPTIDDHSGDELQLTEYPVQHVTWVRDEDHNVEGHRGEVDASHTAPLILQDLNVHKGQSVSAGETLCVLTDYKELFIEGLAFEQDIGQLRHASELGWTVDAILNQPGSEAPVVQGLQIAYLANKVDAESRTLHFYVRLPNEITKDRRADGDRYIEWKFLPGQRTQLRVPVETWPDQIVLSVDAVAREGAESFVFRQNGNHFDRVPVHVRYRDQYSAVVANDGAIFPGDILAMRGAHQMQMALRNKAGGAVDPHAGHSH